MRLTTQDRLLREAVREMLREGSERTMGMSARSAQDLRDYEKKEAEFRAASIPSSLGDGGFVGKSVKLGHLNGDDREALIVGRNSSSDASATQYLVYFSIDPGNISFSDSKMMYPPSVNNVSQVELDSILSNSSWSLSQRALDLAIKNMPERFRLITGEKKPWRIFGPIVAHDAADVIMTGGGMVLDTMGALAELSPTLASRIRDPRAILALGVVKALDKVWTAGGMAASSRNVIDSWNGYVDVHNTRMMDPENKRKKIEAQSAAVALDVTGFLLSGLALYIDRISKDGSPTSAAVEMIPVVMKWGAYTANMGMNSEEALVYVRDIWNGTKDALEPVLKSAIRTATGDTLQALEFFDKMIHS